MRVNAALVAFFTMSLAMVIQSLAEMEPIVAGKRLLSTSGTVPPYTDDGYHIHYPSYTGCSCRYYANDAEVPHSTYFQVGRFDGEICSESVLR